MLVGGELESCLRVFICSCVVNFPASGGKSICLLAKERQARSLPFIVVSVFCGPRFYLNCNIVQYCVQCYSVVDNPL